MLYHVDVWITGLLKMLYENKTRDDVITQYLCPFINREITNLEGKIFNMLSFGGMRVYKTEKPIDSN